MSADGGLGRIEDRDAVADNEGDDSHVNLNTPVDAEKAALAQLAARLLPGLCSAEKIRDCAACKSTLQALDILRAVVEATELDIGDRVRLVQVATAEDAPAIGEVFTVVGFEPDDGLDCVVSDRPIGHDAQTIWSARCCLRVERPLITPLHVQLADELVAMAGVAEDAGRDARAVMLRMFADKMREKGAGETAEALRSCFELSVDLAAKADAYDAEAVRALIGSHIL
jgi:hypothetical protein